MFRVIYADPPWRYQRYGQRGHGAVARHYATMTPEEIGALPVLRLAADPCALFLWGTWPKMREALQVIGLWGFEFKTCAFVWEKTNADGTPFMGLGSYTRLDSEFVLLATRGEGMTKLRRSARVRQTVRAPVLAHSQKPGEVRARIEALFPGPYVELFARHAPTGWSAWGDQVEGDPRVAEVLGG